VKFYALRGAEFFHGTTQRGRATDSTESACASWPCQPEALGSLFVFGGDAIITPDGAIVIIDLNDWPKLRSVRIGLRHS